MHLDSRRLHLRAFADPITSLSVNSKNNIQSSLQAGQRLHRMCAELCSRKHASDSIFTEHMSNNSNNTTTIATTATTFTSPLAKIFIVYLLFWVFVMFVLISAG